MQLADTSYAPPEAWSQTVRTREAQQDRCNPSHHDLSDRLAVLADMVHPHDVWIAATHVDQT